MFHSFIYIPEILTVDIEIVKDKGHVPITQCVQHQTVIINIYKYKYIINIYAVSFNKILVL
jgi:hypothetical protein